MSHLIALIVTALRLYAGANDLPDVDPAKTNLFVTIALDEQMPRVPAALLVSLGWGESRFDPAAQPACGAMQVYPKDLDEPQSRCAEWRKDLRAGIRAGVREIEVMLADKRVRGDLKRALLYRACGNAAFDGTCDAKKYAWVNAAIARWHALERHATFSN